MVSANKLSTNPYNMETLPIAKEVYGGEEPTETNDPFFGLHICFHLTIVLSVQMKNCYICFKTYGNIRVGRTFKIYFFAD